MSAWNQLEETECDAVWNRFYKKFRFKPGVKSSDWPGIVEPAESITFSIGPVYDGHPEAYNRRTHDLGVKLIRAFRRCVGPADTIYVLDWHHPCYSFAPHGEFHFEHEDDWPIPALPNGDYYIFLARDLEWGVFGHPWEQTMCVFGRRVLDAIHSDPRELFTTKVRVGGRAV